MICFLDFKFCSQVIYVNRFSSSSRKNAVDEIKVKRPLLFSHVLSSQNIIVFMEPFIVYTNMTIHYVPLLLLSKFLRRVLTYRLYLIYEF